MKPERIQLSRKKGWKLPANTVVVSRPSFWGNPIRVMGADNVLDQARTVEQYRAWLSGGMAFRDHLPVLARLPELRGKNLACWCKPGTPCHADVLLELANA